MIKFKNYYEILGVTPDSSNAEIKSAYRRLARKYHPDVNPSTAELFKDITEAYTTLINPEKRRQYNILNGFFENQKTKTSSQKAEQEYKEKTATEPNKKQEKDIKSDFGQKQKKHSEKVFADTINDIFKEFTKKEQKKPEPQNGADITADVTINIAEALKGTERSVNVLHTKLCPKCQGRKFINGSKCSACDGKGEVSEHRKITVKIPAKIKNGTKLRVKGEGNPGKFGGKNGDLYLNINIQGNSKIKYDGLNVYYEVPITPFEAVLGGEIVVNTLEGNIRLKIPARTNSGQKFRLSGQGVKQKNKSGDIIVTVHIEIPQSLSDDEIKLYEKLKKASSHNVRENLLND